LNTHSPKEDVPFLCKICGYRAFRRDFVEKHFATPRHQTRRVNCGTTEADEALIVENRNARGVIRGVDISQKSVEESRDEWRYRQRRQSDEVDMARMIKELKREVAELRSKGSSKAGEVEMANSPTLI
jgi:hypothetical protein